jgi:mono/diheme cytochrome c family protein
MTSAGLSVCLAIVVSTALPGSAFAAPDPAAVFSRKCSACHTFGRGDRVGPDLKGVTNRRSRTWLSSWIRSSQRMVTAHDSTAVGLFEKYKRERMPDQNLSDADIAALLDYLAAGGPLTAAPGRPRHASTATAADVALGRDLFLGSKRPRNGGASCASCHGVRDDGVVKGGTFANDLTHVYSRYQDTALSDVLRRPCSPRSFTTEDGSALTDTEAFAVKAFLQRVDREASRINRKNGGLP